MPCLILGFQLGSLDCASESKVGWDVMEIPQSLLKIPIIVIQKKLYFSNWKSIVFLVVYRKVPTRLGKVGSLGISHSQVRNGGNSKKPANWQGLSLIKQEVGTTLNWLNLFGPRANRSCAWAVQYPMWRIKAKKVEVLSLMMRLSFWTWMAIWFLEE